MRRRLLMAIADKKWWLPYSLEYLYARLVPESISYTPYKTKRVFDKGKLVKIRGSSEVKNQLAKALSNSDWEASNATVSYAENIATFTVSEQNGGIFSLVDLKQNHRYLVLAAVKNTSASEKTYLRIAGTNLVHSNTSTNYQMLASIYNRTGADTNAALFIHDERSSSWDAIQVKDVQLIDLTQEFPFNTPTSLDDPRVKNIIAHGCKSHNVGKIEDSTVDEIQREGFNLWDEEWAVGSIDTATGENVATDNRIRSKNFCRCLGNTVYYMKSTYNIRLYFYDNSYAYITNSASGKNTAVTSPANAAYFKLQNVGNNITTYNHDICISVSSSLNGIYLPYQPQQYLPSEYQGVEYIESHGTEYIDSGVTLNSLVSKIETKMYADLSQGTQAFFGTRVTTSSKNCSSLYVKNDSADILVVDNRNNSSNTYRVSINNGTAGTYILSMDKNVRSIIKDDVLLNRNTAVQTTDFTCEGSCYIGKINTNEVISGLKGKIYYFKIYNSDILVRNFIPCLRRSDGTPGLYDLVNNVFYTNQGTGTFTVGKYVNRNSSVKLPAPVTLAGVNTTQDTFEITDTNYVFTRNVWNYYFTGSERWTASGQAYYAAGLNLPCKNPASGGVIPNVLCDALMRQKSNDLYTSGNTLSGISLVNNCTWIGAIDYANMSNLIGKRVLYELATPQIISIPRKHFGAVRLKDLSWGTITRGSKTIMTANVTGIKNTGTYNYTIFVAKYLTSMLNNLADIADKSIMQNAISIYIYDTTYATAQDFVRSLSNDDVLFYETESEVTDFVDVFASQPGAVLTARAARLPLAYQEVEYIESTGTQYIDTGIYANENLETHIVFSPATVGSIFGIALNNGKKYYGVNCKTTSQIELYWGSGAEHPYVGQWSANSKYDLIFNQKGNKLVYINDTQVYDLNNCTNTKSFSNDYSIYLFRLNGDYTQYSSAKLYSCKMYNGSTLVRDFVPCYRKSDNVIGLYDLITRQFYTNSGSGTFLKGENVTSPPSPVLPCVDMEFLCK